MNGPSKLLVHGVLIVAIALAAAGCGKTPPIEPQAPAGGRLEVDQPVFDNGTTIRGDVIKHVFKLKNSGDSPVTILDVKAGCSCTAAVVSESVVEPGSTASVEVSFNTRGRSGAQSKSVKVFTNAATTPVVILTVSGKVEPAVAFSSSNLQFGNVIHDTSRTMELDLIGLKSEGVTISGLKLSPDNDPRFQAVIDPASAGRRVKVTFNADSRRGVFRGRVDATTTSADVPSIYATVLADVTGDVIPDSADVMFPPRGKVSVAEQTRQNIKVRLKSLTGKPFKVAGVTDPAGLVKLVSVNPVEDGQELTLEGPLDTVPVDGTLTVKLVGADSLELKYSSARNRPGRGFVGPVNGRPGQPGRMSLPGDVRMIQGRIKPWEKDPSRPANLNPRK